MTADVQWSDYDSSTCSIARTLELVGDRWSLLLLRDLFNGVHRFDELRGHVGVSRDVLSKRLAALVDAGLVERRGYRLEGERARASYHLTEAGKDLQSVLVALMAWGDRHLAGGEEPPARLEHAGCGGAVTVALACEAEHPVAPRDVRLLPTGSARRRTSPASAASG
jgi:DNA-binding HxlR family transcriptional regulator